MGNYQIWAYHLNAWTSSKLSENHYQNSRADSRSVLCTLFINIMYFQFQFQRMLSVCVFFNCMCFSDCFMSVMPHDTDIVELEGKLRVGPLITHPHTPSHTSHTLTATLIGCPEEVLSPAAGVDGQCH